MSRPAQYQMPLRQLERTTTTTRTDALVALWLALACVITAPQPIRASDNAAALARTLAPPWVAWGVTDDNVMGGVSQGSVEVMDVASNASREEQVLVFSGEVSFDNNGGFSSASSHYRGARLIAQLLSPTRPAPLDLSSLSGGGIKLTFRGDPDMRGPLAFNLGLHQQRAVQLGFGGVEPVQTSAAFAVDNSSMLQTWHIPFSAFIGTRFTRPDPNRRVDLRTLSSKLGLQVSFQEGPFFVEILRIEAVSFDKCEPPAPQHLDSGGGADAKQSLSVVAADAIQAAATLRKKGDYGGGALYPTAPLSLLQLAAAKILGSTTTTAAASAGDSNTGARDSRRVFMGIVARELNLVNASVSAAGGGVKQATVWANAENRTDVLTQALTAGLKGVRDMASTQEEEQEDDADEEGRGASTITPEAVARAVFC